MVAPFVRQRIENKLLPVRVTESETKRARTIVSTSQAPVVVGLDISDGSYVARNAAVLCCS